MIWLTWRQMRGQAVAAVAVLAAVAIYLVVLGLQIRQAYEDNVDCTGCSLSAAKTTLGDTYEPLLELIGWLVLLVPAVIGAFWGAPLIAREFETGTFRLVWNQSVTRTRWLAVKLALVTLAGVAVTGALSLLLTWAASPYDELFGGRFEPQLFATRNIAPLGYAVFAVVLGTIVGLLARRTLLAMAITLAAVVALQILVPTAIRPHLQPPVTESVALGATEFNGIQGGPDGVRVFPDGAAIQGAWVLSSAGADLHDADGNPITFEQFRDADSGCPFTPDPAEVEACFAEQDWYYSISYQPADRYWTFQWLELGGYLVLAGLLTGFAFWRIRRA